MAASDNGSCTICCETFTKQLRRPVECCFCQHTTCVECVKKFLLSSLDDPMCLSCKHPWNREFLDKVLTKSWRKGVYKAHREQVLLERERALLPSTQPLVEKALRDRRIDSEIEKMRDEIRQLFSKIDDLEQDKLLDRDNGGTSERRQFIRPCPGDGCRGYLSSQWKCGICDLKVCSRCHEAKTGDHVCLEDNVKSAEATMRDTKPCPSCGVRIFKIDGCSQMWCISCHVAFDWQTMRVIQGPIHNPEYIRYQREHGVMRPREAGDVHCGGFPAYGLVRRKLRLMRAPAVLENSLIDTLRMMNHILQYQVMPRFMGNYEAVNNSDLRVKYMLNELSEKEWQKTLRQRETKREREQAVRNVLDMATTVGIDLFIRLEAARSLKEIHEIADELDVLRMYTNDQLEGVSDSFDCVVYIYNEDWRPHRHSSRENRT
jgi:hypothetical protein